MFRFRSLAVVIPIALVATAGLQAQVQAGAPARVAPAYSKQQGVKSEATAPPGLSIFAGVAAEPGRPGDVPPPQPAPSPSIEYQNGLLTIEAFDSTLGDVLSAIVRKTGILIEGADSAPEKVAFVFGPAPPSVVLDRLLEGSRFGYVIIGQPDNHNQVQRVILSLPTASVESPRPNVALPPPNVALPRPNVAISRPNRQELLDEDTDSADPADSGRPQAEASKQPALSNYGPQSGMGVRAQDLKDQAQQRRNLVNQQPPTEGGPPDVAPPKREPR